MRSADRPSVTKISISLILGLMNKDIEDEEILALKEGWQEWLSFDAEESDDPDDMWEEVLEAFGIR